MCNTRITLYNTKIINPMKALETGVWLGLSTNSILASGIKNSNAFSLDSIDLPRADIKNANILEF